MPATDTLALTREELRRRWCGHAFEAFVCTGICTVGALAGLAAFGASIYWLVNDVTVQNSPDECFERKDGCEILNVFHFVIESEQSCVDRFSYVFRGPGSPAEYFQREFVQRPGGNCSVDLSVGKENATFQVGPTACFVRLDRFQEYNGGSLNCAEYFGRTDNPAPAKVNECFTLLDPASSFEPSLSIAFFFFVLILCCMAAGG